MLWPFTFKYSCGQAEYETSILNNTILYLLHRTINIQVIFHTYENGQPYEAHTGT